MVDGLLLATIILTVIILILSSLIFIYLYRHRYEYPYTNASSFWERVILCVIGAVQFYILIFSVLISVNEKENIKEIFKYGKTVWLYYFNIIIILLLIARCLSISKYIEYYYYLLSKNTFDNMVETAEHETGEQGYAEQFKKSNKMLFFKVIVIYSLIFVVCLSFGITREMLFSTFSNLYEIDSISTSDVTSSSDQTKLLLKNILGWTYAHVLIFWELGVMFFIWANATKFSLKKDKYWFFYEMIAYLITTFLYYDIQEGVLYFSEYHIHDLNQSSIIDTLLNLLLILVIVVFCLWRKNAFKVFKMQLITEDFESFMRRDVTFQIFRNYINKNNEDKNKILSFWVDFLIYKESAKDTREKVQKIYKTSRLEKSAKLIEVTEAFGKEKLSTSLGEKSLSNDEDAWVLKLEEEWRNMAKEIFEDYYSYNTDSTMNKNESLYMTVDFPTDIYEKLEEMYKNDFANVILDGIFDESFLWVNGQLLKIFNEFKDKKEEQSTIERILFFLDCFEAKA